jgi:hypothetical protein
MRGLGSGVLVIVLLVAAGPGAAQSREPHFELSGGVVLSDDRLFEGVDTGVGVRFGWRLGRLVGIEAELVDYPGKYPRRGAAISRSRIEGLFGATIGPHVGGVRPFARVRPGFLEYRSAPDPLACVLIFPPPVACVLASGRTVATLDLGGGIEFSATSKTFVRVDAGDRVLKYPGPISDRNLEPREHGFVAHAFRLAAGAGLRF